MACRDGIFNNDTVSKQYFSMVAGPIWSRFGSIFLVQKFHIFGLCSRSCQSFSILVRPVGDFYMRIQILSTRASRKFVVKSLNEAQVGHVVMKFQIFNEKSWFCWNSVSSKSGPRDRFPEGLRPQNRRGSCAARNVHYFGDATCSTHAWWFSWWRWWRVSWLKCYSMYLI